MDIPEGKARLNVIGFSGVTPIKKEDVTRIRINSNTQIKIALPILEARPSSITRIEVVLNSGEKADLEPIESIDAVYEETYKRAINGIRAKTIIRATAKAVASEVTAKVGENVGGTAGSVMQLAGMAGKVGTELSEKADIRTSRFFPSKAWVTGINVDPGLYTVTVTFYAGNSVVHQEKYEHEVKVDGLNLIESFCLN
jgi:hypothetical protein